MRIYINERILEDSFLSYIKNRLKLKNLVFISHGAEGITFAINDYRIIKFTRTYPQDYEPFLNEKFDHLMNVYNIGEIDVPKKFITTLSTNNDTKKYVKLKSTVDDKFLYFIQSLKDNKIYYVIAERLYDNQWIKDTYINEIINAINGYIYIYEVNITSYYDMYQFFLENKGIEEMKEYVKSLSFYKRDTFDRLVNFKDTLSYRGKYYIYQILKAFEDISNVSDITHFDLHLGNILFNKKNEVKLIDYDNNFVDEKNINNISSIKNSMKNRVKI